MNILLFSLSLKGKFLTFSNRYSAAFTRSFCLNSSLFSGCSLSKSNLKPNDFAFKAKHFYVKSLLSLRETAKGRELCTAHKSVKSVSKYFFYKKRLGGKRMNSIFTRKSVRKYKKDKISDEILKKILEAGMSAPSAGASKEWRFIVVNQQDILDKLSKVSPYSWMVKDAPVAIVVCGDMSAEKYEGYWSIDCAAASENILLEAEENEIGSVWLGVYPEMERVEDIKKIFNLPENIIPFAIIPLGYYDNPKAERPSRYDENMVHYNKW